MIEEQDYPALADRLLPALLKAGRLLEGYRSSGVAAESKHDGSPVSEADRKAEEILLTALATAAPGIPCIGEEAMAGGTAQAAGQASFYVDALDGTRGFLNGDPEYTLNIGLVELGEPLFGMVYAPAFGRLFCTVTRGAAVELRVSPSSHDMTVEGPGARRISVRRPATPPLKILASTSSNRKLQADLLARLPETSTTYMSSSLKFGLIACGEADLYPRFGPTSFWDTVAGHAILIAAGGAVTTPDGKPMRYVATDGGFLNGPFLAWGDTTLMRATIQSA